MKKSTIGIVSTLCIALILGMVPTANAEGIANNAGVAVSEKSRHTIQFQGNTFSLLDTFSKPTDALRDATSLYGAEFDKVKNKYGLGTLTEETASSYKQAFISEEESNTNVVWPIIEFLDMYENSVENKQIIQQLNQLNAEVESGEISQSDAHGLAMMYLPAKPENQNDKPTYALRNSGINLRAARNYAEKWAFGSNVKFGIETDMSGKAADCTNFVSQILYAGGVPMDSYRSQNKGWWWKSYTEKSIAWRNANVFKNYMGSGFLTSFWNELVKNVRSGDLIGIDYNRDGVVDHVGFVHTAADGKRLLIAQHTTNYLKYDGGWPSHSGHATYYRIRR